MTKLIINADDFGYSKGVNLGIIEAYQNGVVTSTTMMTNMPGAAHAAALAQENPGLGVGIHLVLDCGRPVHPYVPSLVDEKGSFHKIEQLIQYAESTDIEKELLSQIDKFHSFGFTATHLDGHHHIHAYEKVYPIVEKIAQTYNLPIRKASADPNHSSHTKLQTTEMFFHQFYGDKLSIEGLLELFERSLHFGTAEIMCHPAYIDDPLLQGSSYALPRVRELAILTDPNIQSTIKAMNIELATYKEVFS